MQQDNPILHHSTFVLRSTRGLKRRPTLPEKLEWARSRPLLNIPGPGGHAYVRDAHNGLLNDAGDFQAVELLGADISQDLAERLE